MTLTSYACSIIRRQFIKNINDTVNKVANKREFSESIFRSDKQGPLLKLDQIFSKRTEYRHLKPDSSTLFSETLSHTRSKIKRHLFKITNDYLTNLCPTSSNPRCQLLTISHKDITTVNTTSTHQTCPNVRRQLTGYNLN